MIRCSVASYTGTEAYIFFDFYSKDAALVYPIIERLHLEGFRVSFDDGTCESKALLKRLLRSTVCIMAVTESAANSHEFREDMAFALTPGKSRKVYSFLFSESSLRPSFRLYLEHTRCIKVFEAQNEENIYRLIGEEKDFADCRDASIHPEPSQLVEWRARAARYAAQLPTVSEDYGSDSVYIRDWYKDVAPDKYASKEHAPTRPAPAVPSTPPLTRGERSELNRATGNEPAVLEDEGEETIMAFSAAGDSTSEDDSDSEKTVMREKDRSARLIRLKTGEIYRIDRRENRVGRSKRQVNVFIGDNPAFSRVHANIFQVGGIFRLQDAGSTYGTFFNGRRLAQEEVVALPERALLGFADEEFFFIVDSAESNFTDTAQICLLRSVETGELRLLENGILPLNRNSPWPGGALTDRRISRAQHAEIIAGDGAYKVRALQSANGTYLNGSCLAEGEERTLHDGDTIILGNAEKFVYSEITVHLREREKSCKEGEKI